MPAIRQMYEHGLSLMPGAVEGELSRGHPLFFHFLGAAWMHVFGGSHVAMHSFALTISLLFTTAIYYASLRIFGRRVAVLAIVLVASQQVFFVQSAFVLLEMLLAFLAFISLYFYVSRKYLFTAFSLAALFLTKESGLVLGAVLGIDACISLVKHRFRRGDILMVVSLVASVIPIGLFFLLQKHILGWYVLPLYSGLIEHNWQQFWYKFRIGSIRDIFYANLKYLDFLLVLLFSLLCAVRQRKPGYLVFWLPGAIIYYFVDDLRAGRLLPGIPFFIVFLISVWWVLLVLRRLNFFETEQQKNWVTLSAWFIVAFCCFSAANFFTYRYLLTALMPLLVVASFVLVRLTERSSPRAYYLVLVCVLAVSSVAVFVDHDHGDVDLQAFDGVKVQADVVRYFEQHVDTNASVCAGSFMESEHLKYPATGFLTAGKTYRNIHWEKDAATQYIVCDNMEVEDRYPALAADTTFRLVFRTQRKGVWAEVYRRK